MTDYKIKKLNISEIDLDEKNPRLEPTNSQREAINMLMADQKDKLMKLINHISINGLNPTARILVFKEHGKIIDGDGNRRVAAIKIAHTPEILDDQGLIKTVKSINIQNFPYEIDCVIFESRKDAEIWIKLNHNGQGGGEGTIPWSSKAKDRFNNEKSIGTQLIEQYVEKIDQSSYQKTTMDRFFGNKFIKKKLNLKITDGKVDFDVVNVRIAKILIENLKNVKVSEVYDNEKIKIFYHDNLNNLDELDEGKKNNVNENPPVKSRPTTKSRNGVVAKDFKLMIHCEKTNNILNELKVLDVSNFPNASACLLRVFLELSTDYYLCKEKIDFNKEMKLSGRIKLVLDKINLSKDEKKVLSSIISNKDNPVNTNILNSYVHNRHHHPEASSLKTGFDNLKPLFIKIYDK